MNVRSAIVVIPPVVQCYGHLVWRERDKRGLVWSVAATPLGKTKQLMTPDEMEMPTGLLDLLMRARS